MSIFSKTVRSQFSQCQEVNSFCPVFFIYSGEDIFYGSQQTSDMIGA
jgi:hypothetical protein